MFGDKYDTTVDAMSREEQLALQVGRLQGRHVPRRRCS